MQRVKDTGKRPRPRSTNSRLPKGWPAGCSSGRKRFPLPTDAAAQETLRRKEERAGHGPAFLTLVEQAFTRLASGVYSGNCLWPLSLPSLPLCLECKPSVLGSMLWNNVDGGHVCQMPAAWLIPPWECLFAGRDEGRGPRRKFNSHSLVICKCVAIGSY